MGAARPCSLGGRARPPPLRSPPQWGRLAPSPGGCGRGPRGASLPRPSPAWGCAALAPNPLRLCAAGRGSLVPRCAARPRALFALSASPAAPGSLPRRGSASARRARRRFASRSGAWRPRFARRVRPSGAPPRLPRSGLVRACFAAPSAPSRCPRCAWVALAALRASSAALRLPLLPLGLPLALRGLRAGSPPAPARFAASGAGGSRPGGFGAASPRSFAPAPGAWFCSPRLRGCAGVARLSGVLPPPPPRPCAPRWGAAGSGRLRLGGCRPRAASPRAPARTFNQSVLLDCICTVVRRRSGRTSSIPAPDNRNAGISVPLDKVPSFSLHAVRRSPIIRSAVKPALRRAARACPLGCALAHGLDCCRAFFARRLDMGRWL